MDQGMGGEQFLSWGLPVHGNPKAGAVEVPRILPALRSIEEGIGVVTSLGMDHEEVFVICPVGILDDPLEMGCPGRNRIQESVETGKPAIPVHELLSTSTDKLSPVIQLDSDGASRIVGAKPEQHEGNEQKPEGCTQGIRVGSEPAPRCHLHEVPLIGGKASLHHVVIDIGR